MLGVLLLVDESALEEFVLEFLKRQRVTVARSPEEFTSLLRSHRYGLVIVTNFGIGPSQAVSVVPAERDYPVLFLTGYLDKSIEAICREKDVPWRMVPVEPEALLRELRLALDELRP